MNKHDLVEGLLFSGLRLMAFACVFIGGLQLIFQIAEVWYRFDPNYLAEFLYSTVFRPAVLILAGLVLCLTSRWLARRMAKPFMVGDS